MENKISVPRGGMKKSIDPRNLTENDITHAMNVSEKDSDGDYIDYSYEKSNVKAVTFPSGYKVIGRVSRMLNNSVYYLLTNPDTGNSLFGYVKDESYDDSNLEDSLEDIEQEPYKEFVTLIDDSCSENKFNFSVLYPIHNIVLKEQKTGGVIYFTDFINPSRYIELDNIEKYFTREVPCEDDEQLECPDIEKMRIHKLYMLPYIEEVNTVVGGTLNRGTYSFLIALSDSRGRELSEYTSQTLPVSIWDNNEEITNKAIRVLVRDIDPDYTHFKIVIKHNSHLDNATSYYVAGVYPSTNREVNITSIKMLDRISLEQLTNLNVRVTNSENLTTFNNSLVEYGLVFEREVNLQPIANMLGSYLQWQTHVAKEDYYKYAESSSKVGYNRNEVVPFSIRFLREGGSPTALFPLVSREAKPKDKEIVSNRDTESLDNSFFCEEFDRNERWKIYNTASVIGGCGTPEEYVEITEVVNYACTNNNVAETGPGSFMIGPDDEINSIGDYLQSSSCEGEICDILEQDYTEFVECESPCNNNPELVDYQNFISGEGSLKITDVYSGGRTYVVVEDSSDYYGDKVTLIPAVTYPDGTENSEFTLSEHPSNAPLYFKRRFQVALRGANGMSPAMLQEHIDGNIPQSFFYIVPDDFFGFDYIYDQSGATTKTYPKTNGGSITVTYPGLIHAVESPYHQGGCSFFKGRLEEERILKVVFNKMVAQAIPQEGVEITDALLSIYEAKAPHPPNNPLENKFGFYEVPLFRRVLSDLGDKEVKLVPIENNKTKIVILDSNGNVVEEHVSNITPDSRDIFVTITYPHIPVTTDLLGGGNRQFAYRVSPRGMIAVYLTKGDLIGKKVDYDNLIVGTTVNYRDTCTFLEPVVKDCETSTYKKGEFAYWESTSQYPDNPELFDSTSLRVSPDDIPEEYRNEFEQKFTVGMGPNGYRIKSSFDLTCQPIRHFKFPDNKISPFMSTEGGTPFNQAYIYPLGVTIDENIINVFLDIAVKNGLLTEDERKEIYGYEIFRGDISLDRSVIASGLLYDTRTYKERGADVRYLNYPYNSYSQDYLNKGATTPQGFGVRGHDYGFHSPETDYSSTVTASEIRIEGYQYGNSKGHFDEVEKHPKMVVLASDAYSLASTLATMEVTANIANRAADAVIGLEAVTVGTGSTNAVGVGVKAGLIGTAFGFNTANELVFNYGRYRLQWQETIRNLGQPVNFAYYYFSEGNYNLFKTEQTEGNMVRNLTFIDKIKDSRYSITDRVYRTKTELNNIDREYTTYIKVGEENYIQYPSSYSNYDKESLTYASKEGLSNTGRSAAVYKRIASPYAQIVNYLPNQYGTLDRVSWITTGYRGDLRNPSSECLPIFGGDTYITRHSLKRKMPLFLTTAMGQASMTPFAYKNYSNIGEEPTFYLNYDVGGEFTKSGSAFPEVRSYFVLDNETIKGKYYVNPSKFYLYYYGVPSFLTETRINTHFRESGREPGDNFYPNVGDLGKFTQESYVPIRTPNFFKYTNTYSNQAIPFNSKVLSLGYTKENSETVSKSPNGVIFSLPDLDENSQYDPWLKFRALDFHEFDTRYGKLIELKGIENEAILARFEHTAIIYNKVSSTVDDGSTPTGRLGGRDLFQRRSLSFVNSELGYGGSQQSESLSCEYGHFYPDTVRGQFLQIPTGGGSIHDISYSNNRGEPTFMSDWFKKHLPFKILQSGIEGIEELDVDNNYNGIGITMAYDNQHKRILLTKKDYLPVVDCIKYSRDLGFYTDGCDSSQLTCPDGYYYDVETGTCKKMYEIPFTCPEGYYFDEELNTCVRETNNPLPPVVLSTPMNVSENDYTGADIMFFVDAGYNNHTAPTSWVKRPIIEEGIRELIENGDFESKYGTDIRYAIVMTNYQPSLEDESLIEKWYVVTKFTSKEGALSGIDAVLNMDWELGVYNNDYTIFYKYSPMDLMIYNSLVGTGVYLFPDNELSPTYSSIGPIREESNIKKLAYVIGNHARGSGFMTDPTNGYSDIFEQTFQEGIPQAATFALQLRYELESRGIETFAINTLKDDEPSVPPNFDTNEYTYNESWFLKTLATTECAHYFFDPFARSIYHTLLATIDNIGITNCYETEDPLCDCEVIDNKCMCEDEVDPIEVADNTIVDLYDENYFREVSWTISYNPASGSFTSYMDYAPNYYVNRQSYFESGLNEEETSLWTHGVTNKSYGVFYGKHYPKEIEILTKNSLKEYLGNVELMTEAKRYYDNDDFKVLPDITYNESVIYNRRECSGKLSLELAKGRLSKYPINEDGYQIIPITKTESTFNYNYFFDRVENDGPFIINDDNQIRFELENINFKQRKPLARLNGDYFRNRLTYNTSSKYNLTLKLHKGLVNKDNL